MLRPVGEETQRPTTTEHTDRVSVESVVRAQLAKALGGRRGMAEAALPTLTFTVTFVATRELRLALGLSVAAAVVLLLVRLVQRSNPQFVVNSFFGIGLGALFAWRAARGGGDTDPALAYFLPGILYNAVYAVVIAVMNLLRWPVVGFMVGAATGEPTQWRRNPQVVKLCVSLSWMLVLPCVLRVLVQYPIYLTGASGALDVEQAVAGLGLAKLTMGWPLQLASLAGMVWLLARDHTPMEPEPRGP